jgi:hypothetical protein
MKVGLARKADERPATLGDEILLTVLKLVIFGDQDAAHTSC